ncbi:MAG TPA: hypothetical protein VE690_00180 [Rhodopila sp.]|nr:hypothetical protein [Rhodopila sp.]
MPAATLETLKRKALTRGGLDLYTVDAAADIVQAAAAEGLRVLGLDGFIISQDATQPSLEDSADFSSSKDPYADALRFLAARSAAGLYFEVVLDTPAES